MALHETLALLFTDIEGSTRLWEERPDAMAAALARHDALLRDAIARRGGRVFKTVGDAFCAAFVAAADALAAAVDAQRSLHAEPWPDGLPLRARMAVHVGTVESRDDDHFGPPLNQVARLLALGHGGQTLVSQAAAALAADRLPDGATLIPHGDIRLRDLRHPLAVCELRLPDLPADFPPLRTADPFAHRLPLPASSFVGRERERDDLTALLESHRLVTVTGSGGAGKSRLALEVAAEQAHRFPGGVFLAELAALTAPEMVVPAVAAAVGVRESPEKPLQTALLDALRQRTALLLLDNGEHLLDACAHLADALIRNAPGVSILATSREALGVAGEAAYRIPSLAESDAVRLFVDRAADAHAGFALDDANAATVAQLCARLDGIPLAIELAAARVRALSVDQIAARLDDRFRLLTGGSRTALPRQQTLRALIDWSYGLLTPEEKSLLARLSVFVGGWTLEAAEAVCAGEPLQDWQILDLLTALVDKSLVVFEERRYRVLESIRQYAREKLDDGDALRLRDHHCDHFAALAARWRRAEDDATHRPSFRADADNLLAALEWAEGAPTQPERALALAGQMAPVWEFRSIADGRRRLAALLARDAAPSHGRLEALLAAGQLAYLQNDIAAADPLIADALAQADDFGDVRLRLRSRSLRAFVQLRQGDRDGARATLDASLALAEAQAPDQVPGLMVSVGALYFAAFDFPSAFAWVTRGRDAAQRAQDTAALSYAQQYLGMLSLFSGDADAALTHLDDAVALRRRMDTPWLLSNSLLLRAAAAQRAGSLARARADYQEAADLKRRLGDSAWNVRFAMGLGSIALEEGHVEEARSLLERGVASDPGDDPSDSVLLRLLLAHVRVAEGESADDLLRENLPRVPGLPPPLRLWALEMTVRCLAALGRSYDAARTLGAMRALTDNQPPFPAITRRRDALTAPIRSALGDDVYAGAVAEGAAMPLAELLRDQSTISTTVA